MGISSLVFARELRLEAFALGCSLAVLITIIRAAGLNRVVGLAGRKSQSLRAREARIRFWLLIDLFARLTPEAPLRSPKRALAEMTRQQVAGA